MQFHYYATSMRDILAYAALILLMSQTDYHIFAFPMLVHTSPVNVSVVEFVLIKTSTLVLWYSFHFGYLVVQLLLLLSLKWLVLQVTLVLPIVVYLFSFLSFSPFCHLTNRVYTPPNLDPFCSVANSIS
jgi:hypothetical protein